MAGPPEIYRAASALGLVVNPLQKYNTRLTLGCCAALVCQKYPLSLEVYRHGWEGGNTDGHDAVLLTGPFYNFYYRQPTMTNRRCITGLSLVLLGNAPRDWNPWGSRLSVQLVIRALVENK